MICDGCHENEAVISYTEIMNGIKKEMHLCEECAAKETGMNQTFLSLTDTSFLANLLASVLGRRQGEAQDENLKKTNIVCPSCQMTYNEFLKYGTFGCPKCYSTFNFLLDGYLKKIHGHYEHIGRHPAYSGETIHIPSITSDMSEEAAPVQADDPMIRVDEHSDIQTLQAALKQAIQREEYEEAARIRDMIRALGGGEGTHA